MYPTFEVAAIAHTVEKALIVPFTFYWLPVFSMNAIPAEIAAWVADVVCACIHSFPLHCGFD